MFKNFTLASIFSIIIIGLFVGVIFVYADWTAPLSSPPTCVAGNPGCDAPINVGITNQNKTGRLGIGLTGLPVVSLDVLGSGWIKGGFRTDLDTYLAVDSGNVGIGTTNPTSKLDVEGFFKVIPPASSPTYDYTEIFMDSDLIAPVQRRCSWDANIFAWDTPVVPPDPSHIDADCYEFNESIIKVSILSQNLNCNRGINSLETAPCDVSNNKRECDQEWGNLCTTGNANLSRNFIKNNNTFLFHIPSLGGIGAGGYFMDRYNRGFNHDKYKVDVKARHYLLRSTSGAICIRNDCRSDWPTP